MKWQIFFVFFILGSILLAQGKSKTYSLAVKEQMEATETSLLTLEGFTERMKSHPPADIKGAKQEMHLLSQDVLRTLCGVVAVDYLDASLTANAHKSVYRWAKNIDRRRKRAENFFDRPRIERAKIEIHIGEAN